jgi:hypothetical protein
MERQTVDHYIGPKLGEGKYTAQGLKYCCPKDGCDSSQTKFNLEINLSKGTTKYLKFHCWACHYKGHLRFLFTDYAISESWRSISELKDVSYIPQDKIEKLNEELPVTIPYYLSDKVTEYLIKERQIHESILLERKVFYCYSEEDKYYNKIIFPFYENGHLIGFSSHDLKTKKYKNHRDLNFVPYKEFINPNYPIIITEGIYDCYSVPNAVPMLGTKPSKELLKFCKDKKVILALDNDIPIEEKKKISDMFYYYGAKLVSIFDLKQFKDLNEYRCKEREELKFELKTLFELLNEA